MCYIFLAVLQSDHPVNQPTKDDGLLVALGRKNIIFVGDEEVHDIITCPPEGWNYFGPSKMKSKNNFHEVEQGEIIESKCTSEDDFLIKSSDSNNILEEIIREDGALSNQDFPKDFTNDQSSAHRPTTLKITINSNDSSDKGHVASNDLCVSNKEQNESVDFSNLKSTGRRILTVGGRQDSIGESVEGAVAMPRAVVQDSTRSERPPRAVPRTATLVKVRVEKRAVGSHARSERSHINDQGKEPPNIVFNIENRAASVEEELADLMAEVKAATSQIKQEVKQIRQSDTPTPDTPTPLKEFREFLNKEEEQDLERLPTIAELQRENEEDSLNLVQRGENAIFPLHNIHSAYVKSAEPVPLVCQCSCSSLDETFHLPCHSKFAVENSYDSTNAKCSARNTNTSIIHNHIPPDNSREALIQNWRNAVSNVSTKIKSESISSVGDLSDTYISSESKSAYIDFTSPDMPNEVCADGSSIFDTVIAGIDTILLFLQTNIDSGRDISAFLTPILSRIEIYEKEIAYASLFNTY